MSPTRATTAPAATAAGKARPVASLPWPRAAAAAILLAGSAVASSAAPPAPHAAAAATGAALPAAAPGQGRQLVRVPAVLPLRARVEPVNRILEKRLDELLPALMREAGVDLWLVIARELAEDPVYPTLVPEPGAESARRTTMLLFHDRGAEAGVERLTVSRYPLGGLYQPAWEGGDLDQQWRRLAELVRERDPRRIAVNVSRHWAVADGLSAGLHARLVEALGPSCRRAWRPPRRWSSAGWRRARRRSSSSTRTPSRSPAAWSPRRSPTAW